MHFEIKMLKNGKKKNIFREKQTRNKVPLMFLSFKVLKER